MKRPSGSVTSARRLLRFAELVVVKDQTAAGEALQPGRLIVVNRGRPRWLKFHCPCGCGDVVSLNLDPRAGPRWSLTVRGSRVTVRPSIWRETGCGSHFIIWESRVEFFRSRAGLAESDADLKTRLAKKRKKDR